ncbi:hypothetical protein CW702_01145 [Candidatus Bathyarchaeota archaeon]|nr:MAG: hypothetical protein CW702_01145 [Candidatus Bathyarchaeota archaeon]
MWRIRSIFLVMVLAVILSVSIASSLVVGSNKTEEVKQISSLDDLEAAYPSLKKAVNITLVKEHMEFFSNLRSRAVGYEGNRKAAEYIYQKFLEYGLTNVTYHNFTVVDAINLGSELTILDTGKKVELHPIRPNLVCTSKTPKEGITGKLIYARGVYSKILRRGLKR